MEDANKILASEWHKAMSEIHEDLQKEAKYDRNGELRINGQLIDWIDDTYGND